MTVWNWSRRAASLVATLLAVGMLSACGDPGNTATKSARADIKVLLPQEFASSTDVARLSVVVEGPGISTPISAELGRNGSAWEGVITDIPAGLDRLFTATAHDSASITLYKGRAGPLSVVSGSTVSVAIVLQPVTTPPPFENVAPVIESLAVSSNPVQPGGTVTLSARASDPNPEDTLSYTWSAPTGTFGSPTAATTSFTAPTTEGVVRILLEVKDSRAASTTMSLDLHVMNPGSVGSAVVSASFNSWPSISSMTGTPSPLVPGTPTRLFVSATDADGDLLSFSWGSGCPGTFDNPRSPSPAFTLAEPSSTGSCSFQVFLSDGRGGQQKGSLTLHISGSRPINQPPLLDKAYSSSGQAGANELITLGVAAHDPEGQSLSFSWHANLGTIRAERRTATSSELDWVAPTCFDAPVSITAVITDAGGASISHTFSISPRPGTECGSTSVSGVRHFHYVVDDTVRHVVPADLSGVTIEAWVPTVDGTGYEYRAGSGLPDGTFSIPDVQRTPYLLQLGTSYVWTSSRKPDLSVARLGRPDVAPLPEGTWLDLRLSLPTPWRLDNDVQLHAPGAGLGYFTVGCASPSFPALEGSAFITGTLDYFESLQWCGNTPGRLDGSRGDVLYVTHLESRSNPDAGVTIQEVRQALKTSALPEADAGTFVLEGALSSLPTLRQPVDFRISEFEAQALTTHPSAQLTRSNLYLGILPGFKEFGLYTGWPDLALASDTTPGQGDSLETFEYGDPYPGHWSRFLVGGASASVSYSVDLPDGGTTSPQAFSMSVTSREPLQSGMTHVLHPQVSPPQDLRLNGLSATLSLSGVGTTPLVSWMAPRLGSPTRYLVRVYRLVATSTGGTGRSTRGSFTTTETQLRLPPGLLVEGSTYFLQVFAYAEPGFDPNRPFVTGGMSHYASAFTSSFKP